MALLRLFLMSGLMLLSVGCAVKRPVRTDIILPVTCVSGQIILTDCIDADTSRCKHSIITYKKGCEIVMAQKHK